MKSYLLLVLILFFIPTAAAAPEKVSVSLYILNLGQYSQETGSFTADFYLHFKCSNPCTPSFEFTNGRAQTITVIENIPDEKFYRIFGIFNSPVDLKSFPFDEQVMQIIIEDTNNTVEKIIYVPDNSESGIDSSIVFPGWNINGWDAAGTKHYYPVYNETYSQYVFTVSISRVVLSSFIKTFLPVLLILLIILFSLLLDTAHIPEILAMSGSGLIASVMFHISISNQIPPVGYLTFADKFMIVTYLIILSTFVLNTLVLGLSEKKKAKVASKIHKYSKYGIFIMALLLYSVLFAFLL